MSRLLKFVFLALICALLATPACQKQSQPSQSARSSMVKDAKSMVDSLSLSGRFVNYRATLPKTIRWDLAGVVPMSRSMGLLVPLTFDYGLLFKTNLTGNDFFHLSYLADVLYYVDSNGKKNILVVTKFPDSNYFKNPTGKFTGLKFVEDWYGNPVEKLLYLPDGSVKRYIPTNKRPDMLEVITTCYSITGYNTSPGLDEEYDWEESAGCSVDYIDDGGGDEIGDASGGGATSGGGSGASGAFSLLAGPSVITSIQSYFKCFTNVGGTDHTYTITVCVDQPDPGTRTPWTASLDGASGSSSAGNNPVDVGHTFLILTETYGNTTITRNVGFYPSNTVTPGSPSSQGQLDDNETHSYNIGGSFTVNNAQFFNALSFISEGNNAGYLYNLNTNNCTTFAINAVAQAGIYLPRTIGNWLGGSGNDPGDLGEDIRKGNIPGMTLNTTGGTQSSHYNEGQCN